MRKSMLALVPTVAAVLAFGAGSAAQASTTPHLNNGSVGTAELDGNGTAGYYTNSFGASYTQVDGTFKLNLPSLAHDFFALSGAIGLQLCDTTSNVPGYGWITEVGAVPAPSTSGFAGDYELVYASGYIDGNPVGNGDPCDGNSFFDQAILIGGVSGDLGYVSPGSTIQAQIKEEAHGHAVQFIAAVDNGPNFAYYLPNIPINQFNEAGAGVSTDLLELSAGSQIDYVDFSDVTAVSAGGQHGFAYWDAVPVESVNVYGTPLVDPTALNPSACVITYHPGHRYYYGKKGDRRYRWIKGYTTSSGCGASSFSIDTSQPLGI